MPTAKKPGLYANIHAKQERIAHGSGEKMRKPGSPGAPTGSAFEAAAGKKTTAKKVAAKKTVAKKAVAKKAAKKAPARKTASANTSGKR